MPKDNDLKYEREVQMLKDEEVKKILNLYYEEAPTNPESAYTFALISIVFMFGLRIGEVLALKKANVDFENDLLHIKGSIVDGKFLNKTKNRGSTRSLEMDKNAIHSPREISVEKTASRIIQDTNQVIFTRLLKPTYLHSQQK